MEAPFTQQLVKFHEEGPYTFEEVSRLASLPDVERSDAMIRANLHRFSSDDLRAVLSWESRVEEATKEGWRILTRDSIHPLELSATMTDDQLDVLADFPEATSNIIGNQMQWDLVGGELRFKLLCEVRRQVVNQKDASRRAKRERLEKRLAEGLKEVESTRSLIRKVDRKLRDVSPKRK